MHEGTTPGKEEVELRQEQQPRATQEHDYRDVGVRVAPATCKDVGS